MLWLRPEQAQRLVSAAREGAPHEVCGVLLGRNGVVEEIVLLANVDPNPLDGHLADAAELVQTLSSAHQRGYELVSVFHSHPSAPPIPSARDIREANYPEALALIISLAAETPEMSAWRILDGRVSRAQLLIQSDRPLPASFEPETLQPSQRLAIIAVGLLAVAFLLFVAFSLLPPPELPT